MSLKETICIAGKNSIAIEGLSYCLRKHSDKNIVFIPNKLDYGVDSWQPSFKRFGEANKVKKVTLNDLYDIDNLIFISLEFSDLIKPNKFKSDNLFNFHFSLLPQYKGMYTSAMPLINGEKISGVTLHKIDEGIDTGDIIDQIDFKINLNDNAKKLYFKYLEYSKILFLRNIEQIIKKQYTSHKQSNLESSYYSKKSINYSELKIDLSKTAYEVHNQFRAFTFREYQMPSFNSWTILETTITDEKSQGKPGTILLENEECFKISTIDYNLFLVKDYYPILWNASKKNDINTVKKIIQYIRDINLPNKNGCNALIIAVYNGSSDCAEFFLNNGADPSSKNHKGNTALMYSIDYYKREKDSKLFQLLLDYGANLSDIDCHGKNIKNYLIQKSCPELNKFLM